MTELIFALIAFILIYAAIQGARGNQRPTMVWLVGVPVTALILIGVYSFFFSSVLSSTEKVAVIAGVILVAAGMFLFWDRREPWPLIAGIPGFIVLGLGASHFDVQRLFDGLGILLVVIFGPWLWQRFGPRWLKEDNRVILQTQRLLLREMRMSDVPALMKTLADPVAMRYYPSILDEEGTIEWVERNFDRYIDHDYGLWAAIDKETGNLVGQIGLVPQEINGRQETEIGYLLSPDNWGKGYATEGAKACMEYAFTVLDKPKVVCMIRPENQPSVRVAERLGMTIEGEFEKSGFKHLIYSRTRDQK